MSTDDFLAKWRFVRGRTAREISDIEYRIIDRAIRTNDPAVILAGIKAVGNPKSLRMIRHQAELAVDKERRKERKANGLTGRNQADNSRGSWWSRLTTRPSRQRGTQATISGIKDKLFFRKLWQAVEPYLTADLNDSKRKELAAAFHSGRADVVLMTLKNFPPTSEIHVVANEIQGLYPRALGG